MDFETNCIKNRQSGDKARSVYKVTFGIVDKSNKQNIETECTDTQYHNKDHRSQIVRNGIQNR